MGGGGSGVGSRFVGCIICVMGGGGVVSGLDSKFCSGSCVVPNALSAG